MIGSSRQICNHYISSCVHVHSLAEPAQRTWTVAGRSPQIYNKLSVRLFFG